MATYNTPFGQEETYSSIKDIEPEDCFQIDFDEAILHKHDSNTFTLYGWFTKFSAIERKFGSGKIEPCFCWITFHGDDYQKRVKVLDKYESITVSPPEFEKLLVKHFDGHPNYWMPVGKAIKGFIEFRARKTACQAFTKDELGVDSDWFSVQATEIEKVTTQPKILTASKGGFKSGGNYQSTEERLNERLKWLKSIWVAETTLSSDTSLRYLVGQFVGDTNLPAEDVEKIFIQLIKAVMGWVMDNEIDVKVDKLPLEQVLPYFDALKQLGIEPGHITLSYGTCPNDTVILHCLPHDFSAVQCLIDVLLRWHNNATNQSLQAKWKAINDRIQQHIN